MTNILYMKISKWLIIVFIFCFSCSTKRDPIENMLMSSKWQYFTKDDLDNMDSRVNSLFMIFEENDIKTYVVGDKDGYSISSGVSWRYKSRDSILYFEDVEFQLLRINNDTVFLKDKNGESCLIKMK